MHTRYHRCDNPCGCRAKPFNCCDGSLSGVSFPLALVLSSNLTMCEGSVYWSGPKGNRRPLFLPAASGSSSNSHPPCPATARSNRDTLPTPRGLVGLLLVGRPLRHRRPWHTRRCECECEWVVAGLAWTEGRECCFIRVPCEARPNWLQRGTTGVLAQKGWGFLGYHAHGAPVRNVYSVYIYSPQFPNIHCTQQYVIISAIGRLLGLFEKEQRPELSHGRQPVPAGLSLRVASATFPLEPNGPSGGLCRSLVLTVRDIGN